MYDVASSSSLSPGRSHVCNFAFSQSHPDPDSPLSIESDWLSNVDLSVSCSSPSSASGVSPLPPVIRETRHDPQHVLSNKKSRFFRSTRVWKPTGRCPNPVRSNLMSTTRLHTTKPFRHLAPRDARPTDPHTFISIPGTRKRSMCLSRPLRGSSIQMSREDASRLLGTSAHGYPLSTALPASAAAAT
ncbi:unnamed protein product, partial [Echinostoma caproni]|uniref:Expressed conserved protein n=1 Tax=Echinostoma caproni TaxID=27848 RepID=A0A183A075_9TREM